MNKKQLLWKCVSLVALLLISAAIILLYFFVLKPKPVEGERTIKLAVVVEKDDVSFVKQYSVRTENTLLQGVIAHLNKSCDFGIPEKQVEDGYFTSGFGLELDPTSFDYYFGLFTSDASKSSTEGGSFTLDGAQLGSASLGLKELPAVDGETYVIALAGNAATLKSYTFPESNAAIDVAGGEKVSEFDARMKQANQMLITVLVIAGAAFVAIVGLFVVEVVKSKRR